MAETYIARLTKMIETLQQDEAKMQEMLDHPAKKFDINQFLNCSVSLKSGGDKKTIVLDAKLAETFNRSEMEYLIELVEKMVKLEDQLTVTEAALVEKVLAFAKTS